MQRPYIVIPEGTPVVVVDASSPKFAASKARRGKGERQTVLAAVVAAESATQSVVEEPPVVIPGQLYWSEDGQAIERA